jgi:hypothetical protein
MPTFWHDRVGMQRPTGAPPPLMKSATLEPLVQLALGRKPG